MKTVRWHAGDPDLRHASEALLARGPAAARTIQSNSRRTLLEAELPIDLSAPVAAPRLRVVIKIHHGATGRHRLRDGVKRVLGRSAARREWHALETLSHAGVPVPRALAHGTLASGDELIVCEHTGGLPFAEAFAAADREARPRMINALAAVLSRLREAGYVHGDLHLANLAYRPETGEVVLLDVQRARRAGSDVGSEIRLADLARLELSLLRADWSPEWRDALHQALGPAPGFDAALVDFVRDHLRGRARRAKRALRPVRTKNLQGERDARLDEATLLRVVEQAAASAERRPRRAGRAWIAEVEVEGARFVVKWSGHASLRERIAAALRGTPAARAFRAGRLHRMLLPRVARPLACLEQRRAGLPAASWLVLERVGEEDFDAHHPASASDATALARTLGRWLADYHALGLGHRDLKGSNLRLTTGTTAKFWLVDLEDLTGPRAGTRDDERLDALAALNASLADESFDAAARREALAAYRGRLPFGDSRLDPAGATAEVVRRSLARAHRWRGTDCGECGGSQRVVTVSQRK